MAESSRCYKYGAVDETVPRHLCEVDGVCEFDFPDMLEEDIHFWDSVKLYDQAEWSRRKLKFSQERAGKA